MPLGAAFRSSRPNAGCARTWIERNKLSSSRPDNISFALGRPLALYRAGSAVAMRFSMQSLKSKKSESLEIRVSYDEKRALMQKAAVESRSASSILRQLIAEYVEPAPARAGTPKLWWKPAATIAFAAGSLAIAYMVTTPASAVPHMRRVFDNLDADHNGVIDRAEFGDQMALVITSPKVIPTQTRGTSVRPSVLVTSAIQLRDDFVGEDSNADGLVTFDEFLTYSRSLARRSFTLMDANRDGRLSSEEFQKAPHLKAGAAAREVFAGKDVDQDGQLTFAEFNA
jgi:Ca2+-binding EF-hand superfamily protein